MKKTGFSLAFLFAYHLSPAQQMPQQPPDTLILGPEKYRAEVIRIYEKYNQIGDSLFKIRTSPNYKRSTDKKYRGHDGVEGYYMDLEFKELEVIVKKFLDIKRVKGTFYRSSGTAKETYYEVSFEGNNKDLKDGRVRWFK